MITYSWDFSSLDCYPTWEGLTNVVFVVYWRYSADDGLGHTAVLYGKQALTMTPTGTFVPFADLTPTIVAGWVEDAMGPDEIARFQGILADAIAEQVAPAKITLSAPWQTPA